jgi:hypothetical protein
MIRCKNCKDVGILDTKGWKFIHKALLCKLCANDYVKSGIKFDEWEKDNKRINLWKNGLSPLNHLF